MPTELYGVQNSNRRSQDHWGKNCFNSSFPTAMACYMLDHDIPAIYNKLEIVDGEPKVIASTISLRDVFTSGALSPAQLYFSFESIFEPYRQYCLGAIDGIDLVVKDVSGNYLAPLEVKLTVLPTDGTSHLPEEQWGCELVVRSATTSYCALGMFDSVKNDARQVRDIFEQACSSIQMWDNDYEMCHKTPSLSASLDCFERQYYARQKPLLMQTIWKTQGKSPFLADQAFDIVVWSDYAFSRLFIDASYATPNTMSRPMRATARLARCLWELSKSGRIRLADIYRQMAFGNQTDKEFAINGQKWRHYVSSERIMRPIMSKDVVDQVLSPGYADHLSPERRLDQTLFFTGRR